MKKTLLILIALLAICGLTFAQHESHWADVSFNQFDMNAGIVAFIQVDNNYITTDDNWTDLEVAAFVDNECRGHAFMQDGTSFGDPYPLVEISIYHMLATTGEVVSFKLYDHSIGLEYDYGTCNYDIVTGEYHIEIYQMDYENAVVLSFTTPLTKEIAGYTENGGYYLIASPIGEVNPEDVTDMLTNNYDLYYFDQTKRLEWINYKGSNGNYNLVPGKGYLYANNQNVALRFTGSPIEGDTYEVSLVKDDESDLAGWNLVGNPFAQTVYLNRDFYVMNVDGTEIVPATEPGIAPMEGVFVVAAEDGEALVFSTDAPSKRSQQIVVNVTRNRDIAIDRAIIRFSQGSMLPKFQIGNNSTKVYIPMDGQEYAIVNSESVDEMPLNFKAEANGTYSINVDVKDMEMSYLHLIDNKTGTNVDLLETPCYSFEAKTTDYASRFKLVFSVCTDANSDNETFAFINNGNFVVQNEGEATLQVIDMTGRLVYNKNINGTVEINLNQTEGVYMLRLVNSNNVKTQKIVAK